MALAEGVFYRVFRCYDMSVCGLWAYCTIAVYLSISIIGVEILLSQATNLRIIVWNTVHIWVWEQHTYTQMKYDEMEQKKKLKIIFEV